MNHPTPPAPVTASDDIAILRAWMDAELQHPGDQPRVLAAVESAVRRCLDRRAGRVGSHYQAIPPAIRPLVGRRDGEGLKALLGRWERDDSAQSRTRFVRGLAGLGEDECAVYWWDVRGWQVWEMQRELTAPGARFDRTLWVAIDRVLQPLEQARGKVLAAFGLA